jgi:hypoxanthine-DNA glycosylase
LREAQIGLWDVVASAHRAGSTDAAIRDIEGHDIAALAGTLPQLRAIAFNGATALRHGLKQLGTAAGRYAIVALPSSSPLHTVGLAAKLPAWQALADYLG